MSGPGERADGGPAAASGWVDLAWNAPGIGVAYEAARRRQADGVGTDRSWRVGADGEVRVAELLAAPYSHVRNPVGWATRAEDYSTSTN